MLPKRTAATKTVSFGTYRDLCICFESWWEVGGLAAHPHGPLWLVRSPWSLPII